VAANGASSAAGGCGKGRFGGGGGGGGWWGRQVVRGGRCVQTSARFRSGDGERPTVWQIDSGSARRMAAVPLRWSSP